MALTPNSTAKPCMRTNAKSSPGSAKGAVTFHSSSRALGYGRHSFSRTRPPQANPLSSCSTNRRRTFIPRSSSVLGDLLNRPGQTLLVTHSPYLIPTRNRDDLVRVARIERVEGQSRLRRLAPATPGDRAEREQEGQLWQLMVGSTDARGLLFASGVVLCEGGTEVGTGPQPRLTGKAASRSPSIRHSTAATRGCGTRSLGWTE